MRKFFLLLAIFIGIGLCAAATLVFLLTRPSFRETVVQQTIERMTQTTSATQQSLVHTALGFEKPRTYLFLFLNNTELRPAGGFIGSYGVIRFTNGMPELLKVEGTEALDLAADLSKFGPPPEPMKKYLKLDHWQLRDSNWSPDFRSSTEQGLTFYRQENGLAADEIDGVIAITPTVVERVLEISGPITVNGVTFTSENFVKTLEDEVEYKYVERGIPLSDRKKMLKDVTREMLKRMMTDVFRHWKEYTHLSSKLLDQKHVVLYSHNLDEQAFLMSRNWAGAVAPTNPKQDYLMWVDANLGALKTDAVMERSLSYSIEPTEKGYVATASMQLKHTGVFDKFTTRYQDYARVFVPEGSVLVKAEGFAPGTPEVPSIAEGVELGKQWFGGFVSIEPGRTKTVRISYMLPASISESITEGVYDLIVQKQIGTLSPRLTLQLSFGTKVLGAQPAENEALSDDTNYVLETDLHVDRAFHVTLD